MLAGEAVVAIWNGIAPEGRDEFYAWHLHEHMPERAAIPGFIRGRRYIATGAATEPEFFTLYEVEDFAVLQGADYASRLNAPTDWTRRATAHFRTTARALARVLASCGPGSGGMLLTVRFAAPDTARPALEAAVRRAAALPRVAGAHLCRADAASSEARTAESKGRADIGAAPGWFALVEATDLDALEHAVTAAELAQAGVTHADRGRYRLEYQRGRTEPS